MSSSENAASQEACEASAADRRIVVLGRTGTGRSSSANHILGRAAFWANVSPCSVTSQCQRQTGTVAGRGVSVVDTPGFLHTHLSPQEVMAEVGRSVALAAPGPHAFLVTLQPGRFTQEERDALEWIVATFGPAAARFSVALFTRGDQLHGKRIEDFLKESEELSRFVASCHGGFHVFDNSQAGEEEQVVQLLKKVDKMVEDNGGSCYSDDMFKEAERAIREAREKMLGQRDREAVSGEREAGDKEEPGPELERRKRREEEEARKRAERLFWCELVTAVGKGAAEGAGIMGKDEAGEGKAVKKVKVVEKVAALAASPLSITAAAKAVGGAVREGSKVFYKHRKTFLH